MSIFALVVLAVALILLFPARAYAYLDPGTGSYLLQLLVAAFIGAMVTLRIYWKKVKVFLHLGSHDSDEERPH